MVALSSSQSTDSAGFAVGITATDGQVTGESTETTLLVNSDDNGAGDPEQETVEDRPVCRFRSLSRLLSEPQRHRTGDRKLSSERLSLGYNTS